MIDVRAYFSKEQDLILLMLEVCSLTQVLASMGVAARSEDSFEIRKVWEYGSQQLIL